MRALTDQPVDLDKHRGMPVQKATDLRRALAEVESNVRELREREADLENRMMAVPAASWPEAAMKARCQLNLYAASLSGEDARRRALVAALLDDFARLSEEGWRRTTVACIFGARRVGATKKRAAVSQ